MRRCYREKEGEEGAYLRVSQNRKKKEEEEEEENCSRGKVGKGDSPPFPGEKIEFSKKIDLLAAGGKRTNLGTFKIFPWCF